MSKKKSKKEWQQIALKYNFKDIDAVKRFLKQMDIRVDGKIGPETLNALNNYLAAYNESHPITLPELEVLAPPSKNQYFLML